MNGKNVGKIIGAHLVKVIETSAKKIKESEGSYSIYDDDDSDLEDLEFYIGGFRFNTTRIYKRYDHLTINLVVVIDKSSASPKDYARVIQFGLTTNVVLDVGNKHYRIESVDFEDCQFDALTIVLVEVADEEIENIEYKNVKVYRSQESKIQ